MNFILRKVEWKKLLYPDLPNSATSEGWNEWNKQARMKKVRWFFADTLPYSFSKLIIWPVGRVKDWIRYRTTSKYHIIKLDHEPGYMEASERLLYSGFTILRKFVEGEKAWMQHISNSSSVDIDFMDAVLVARKEKKIWKRADKRQYAMKYLDWEISLAKENEESSEITMSDNPQSFIASEIKELYVWWKDIRPVRIDPYENKYYVLYHESRSKRNADESPLFGEDDDTPEERDNMLKGHKLSDILSKSNSNDDEEMFIRLIKIREGLWT